METGPECSWKHLEVLPSFRFHSNSGESLLIDHLGFQTGKRPRDSKHTHRHWKAAAEGREVAGADPIEGL